jgi:hypothetical protein
MIDLGFGAPTADPFERWLLRRYASGILAGETRLGTRLPRALLARWLVDNAQDLGAREPTVRPDAFDEVYCRVSNETWQELAPLHDRLLASRDEAAPRPSRLERRLAWLADMLRLHAFDRAILGVLVRAALSRPLRELLDRLDGHDGPVGYNDETKSHLLRAVLGRSVTMVTRRLQSSAPLRCFGLVEDRGPGQYAPSATMLTLARHGGDTPTSLRRLLIGKTTPPELAWSDFAHLGCGRELAEQVLRDALRRRRRGVNILLYGPPGTGKTEFARVLAQRIGACAAFAGETGADGAELEPTRESRIASVALTGALAARVARGGGRGRRHLPWCRRRVRPGSPRIQGLHASSGRRRRGTDGVDHQLSGISGPGGRTPHDLGGALCAAHQCHASADRRTLRGTSEARAR